METKKKTLKMFNKTQLKPLRVVKIETFNPKSNDLFMLEFVVLGKATRPYQIKSSQTMANHLHQESLKSLLAHTPSNMS